MIMTFDVLERLISIESRSSLIQPISMAYSSLGLIVEQHPVFRMPLGRRCIARIRSALVEKSISDFCKAGRIPFQCTEVWTEGKTYPYLTLKTEKCAFDICQTRREKEFPRPAKNRDARSQTAQLSFLDPERAVSLPFYGVITHGGDVDTLSPKFICVGRPDERNRKWDDCKNILLLAREMNYQGTKVQEDESEEMAMSFTVEAMRIIEEEAGDGSTKK